MQKHLEKSLFERTRNGDTEAFGEIYNAYIAKIYRFILFKVQVREEAEDLAAEVFLRAWQYLYQLQRSVDNPNAFFYQVARNLVIDFYRQRVQREVPAESDVLDQVVDQRQQQLFQRIERGLEVAEIEQTIRGLKDDYKEVILLRYVEDLPISEIAEITGKSRGAVRVLIHRALHAIRGQVKQRKPEAVGIKGSAPVRQSPENDL
ncbi:MAG: RNA polymerase sigma factor [Patescibacteria group bacterium]|nr:RNA polymerase sigma factor [Patescibacteria group bacterium]